jgi:hypothetical protein
MILWGSITCNCGNNLNTFVLYPWEWQLGMQSWKPEMLILMYVQLMANSWRYHKQVIVTICLVCRISESWIPSVDLSAELMSQHNSLLDSWSIRSCPARYHYNWNHSKFDVNHIKLLLLNVYYLESCILHNHY